MGPLTKPPHAVPVRFKPDRVVGALLTIEGAFRVAMAFAMFLYGVDGPSLNRRARDQQLYARVTNHIFQFRSPFHDGRTLMIVGLIQLGVSLLLIASGERVRRCEQRGLAYALITAVVTVFVIGYIEAAIIALYAIVRLTGVYGPRLPKTEPIVQASQ